MTTATDTNVIVALWDKEVALGMHLGTEVNLCGIEKSSTVVNGEKADLVLSNSIDNAIAANNNLSDVIVSQLRNYPPQPWIARQSICRSEHPVGEYRR